MREILFRGKRKDNGEWVYGDLRQYTETNKGIYDYEMQKTIKGIPPETVGQYTGLTDKNGTKIFEGDIISAKCGKVKKCGVVYYFERGAKFGVKENSGYDNLSLLFDLTIQQWEIKIIGNIHDNPELLKGGANNG